MRLLCTLLVSLLVSSSVLDATNSCSACYIAPLYGELLNRMTVCTSMAPCQIEDGLHL